MKDALTCRDYQPGDERRIVGLFKQVFGRALNLAVWKWRFAENPFGEAIIKLAFDDEKLVGHYAVIPMSVQVENKLVKAVFSMTTMTHPDYSGRGIFTYLAGEVYRLCQERGHPFVYGFPNKNSYYGFTHKLGWSALGSMTALEKKLGSKTKKDSTAKTVKQIGRFDNTVNSLWDKVKQEHTVIIPRTTAFLNWRFVENPDVGYVKYTISDNSQVLGYVVLKVYPTGDIMNGHIVDILSVPEEQVLKSLLGYSFDFLLERGICNISCWVPAGSFYDSILKEEGFIRIESESYFGVKIFDERDIQYRGVKHFPAWYLTMGDSDVF